MNQHTSDIIAGLKAWSKTLGDDAPLAPSCLTDLNTVAIREIYDRHHENLDQLRMQLTPIAAALRRELRDIPKSRRQAMEVAVLSSVIKGILFIMEHDDPAQAAKLITHGDTVLDIITRLADTEIRIKTIRENWPAGSPPPSAATISRTLGALEEAGFVQRSGTKKGRKIRLLPKAGHWRELKDRTSGNAHNAPHPSTTTLHMRTPAPEAMEPSAEVLDLPGIVSKKVSTIPDFLSRIRKQCHA